MVTLVPYRCGLSYNVKDGLLSWHSAMPSNNPKFTPELVKIPLTCLTVISSFLTDMYQRWPALAALEPSATSVVGNLSKYEQFGMTLLVDGLQFWES